MLYVCIRIGREWSSLRLIARYLVGRHLLVRLLRWHVLLPRRRGVSVLHYIWWFDEKRQSCRDFLCVSKTASLNTKFNETPCDPNEVREV